MNNIVSAVNGFAWGPVTIILLLGTGLYYSILLKGLQFRGFKHALELVQGKYDNPEDHGDINHFQALSAALSATIGTGNIAGVATAIACGGPGAVFWMWVVAIVGMLLKYASCTLSQKYRKINPDGTISGGPMYYLEHGLKQKWLGWLFAFFTMVASFGIGNMVQSNSVVAPLTEIIKDTSPAGQKELFLLKLAIGIVLAILTAAVIIGGIRRIGKVASAVVPVMCIVYVVGALYILLSNFHELDEAVMLIFRQALSPTAATGGFAGATVMMGIRFGVARALFSSEAGLGSAPIIHAAAKTEEPVREGLVAMLEPFVDTLVICSMTALVILTTGAWTWSVNGKGLSGAVLTSEAFNAGFPIGGNYIVTFGLCFFAFSTLISWSYYGDRSAEYLFGKKAIPVYRWAYVFLIPIGAISKLDMVWNISDTFNALMAFPNLIGILGLSFVVYKMTKDYFKKLPTMKTRKDFSGPGSGNPAKGNNSDKINNHKE
ncbi:MAG: alanine/glycine:cation symporter family protein [Vulcanimicrobiota bacterium]